MATRNNTISEITKLATEVAKRDLQSISSGDSPELLSLISAVTEQIKQRSGDSKQLNDLVSMIESTMSASSADPPTVKVSQDS